MREDFYECSVAPERENFQRTISIVYTVLLVISIIFFAVTFYLWLITFDTGFIVLYVPTAIFSTAFILLRRRLCLYFDYTYISGELRVIKVVRGKTRRKFIILDCKNIIQIGKVGSDSFEKIYEQKNQYKLKLATPNGLTANNQLFYVYADYNGEKILLILECEEKLLAYIVSNRGKNIIEKDYK